MVILEVARSTSEPKIISAAVCLLHGVHLLLEGVAILLKLSLVGEVIDLLAWHAHHWLFDALTVQPVLIHHESRACCVPNQLSVSIDLQTELFQVRENRILMHLISEGIHLVSLRVELEDDEVDVFEAAQRVHWTTFPFRSLEEVLSSGVHSLIRVLSGTTSSSAASWRVS